MKRALMSAAAVAFLLMLPELLAAQDLTSSIVGTWKLTSKELATEREGADAFPRTHPRLRSRSVRLRSYS